MTTRQIHEQLYSTIVDNTGEAIIVIQNQRIRFYNARAVELSGYSESEIQRLSWLNLIHPDDRELVLSECSRASYRKEHARVYSIRIHDRNGHPKWLELHHKQIKWNGTDATLVFFRDITERKHLESQFLQAQNGLRRWK